MVNFFVKIIAALKQVKHLIVVHFMMTVNDVKTRLTSRFQVSVCVSDNSEGV